MHRCISTHVYAHATLLAALALGRSSKALVLLLCLAVGAEEAPQQLAHWGQAAMAVGASARAAQALLQAGGAQLPGVHARPWAWV
eukprot:scaffold57839_cov20-Tisochrysis_lutea.AAC.1